MYRRLSKFPDPESLRESVECECEAVARIIVPAPREIIDVRDDLNAEASATLSGTVGRYFFHDALGGDATVGLQAERGIETELLS